MHIVYLAGLGWGGGGVTPDFNWREIEWGQKWKPKRISAPKINPQKIPCRIFRAFITRKLKTLEIECLCRCFVGKIWNYHSRTRIFRLFWIPKKSLLKSSHPNFPTKKNTGIENFIIPITWNPEYNPPPRRLFSSLKFCITIVSCFSLDDTPRRNWKQWPCKILVNRDNWTTQPQKNSYHWINSFICTCCSAVAARRQLFLSDSSEHLCSIKENERYK